MFVATANADLNTSTLIEHLLCVGTVLGTLHMFSHSIFTLITQAVFQPGFSFVNIRKLLWLCARGNTKERLVLQDGITESGYAFPSFRTAKPEKIYETMVLKILGNKQ